MISSLFLDFLSRFFNLAASLELAFTFVSSLSKNYTILFQTLIDKDGDDNQYSSRTEAWLERIMING